jgi:general secretion pathway protein F
MPQFRYEATNAQGTVLKGQHSSEDAAQVRDYLRQQGLTPLHISEDNDPFWKKPIRFWPLSNRVLWIQQIASALEAHLPLLEVLGMQVHQNPEGSIAHEISQSLYTSVQQGQPLDYALRAFPKYFDSMTLTIVRSGLESGRLPELMMDLAKNWEAKQALRQKVLAAALYPILVGIMSLIMTTGLLFFLTPTLENLFAKRWDQLPFITRVMMVLGKTLRHEGGLILIVLCLLIYGAINILQRPATQRRLQQWTLGIPSLGPLRVLLDCARLANTLGLLLSSGIPLLKALEVTTPGVTLYPMRQALERIREQIQQGASLSRAIRKESIFPLTFVHWAESGERSGQLAPRLQQAAHQLQHEAERRLLVLTSLLEPILILCTGLLVLLMVLSILLPMNSIQQLVK